MQATASDDTGIAAVEFFGDGRRAVIGGDTEPPYSSELDLLNYDNGPIVFWATARDVSGNVAITNFKSMFVQNRCYTVTAGQTMHTWIGTQTGTFTVRWTARAAVPDNGFDGGFSLTSGKPNYFSGTSTTVLFAPDGEIKVRDGDHYPASGFRFGENFYRFRMVVDVPSNRYSVWVRRLNQPEQQLAASYAFRKAVTSLDNWMIRMDDAAVNNFLTVCNVTVKPGS
jgi:hypothetical protein